MDLVFKKYGLDFSEDQKVGYTGDIFNHRIRAYFTINKVDFLVECCTMATYRTKHKTTGKELKKRIQTSENNGLCYSLYVLNEKRVERNCTGTFSLFTHEKCIEEVFLTEPDNKKNTLFWIKTHTEHLLKFGFNSVKIEEFAK